MAGARRKARQFRLLWVEGEVSGARLVADVQVVLPQLETGLVIMRAADVGQIIHQDGAAVVRAAAIGRTEPTNSTPTGVRRADVAALNGSAAEEQRGKVRAGHVLQTDLLWPVLIDVDAFVPIAEAVVAERDVI